MKDFPYDIWQVIASHIPERKLRSLYAVNRPLFLASMNIRYQTVSFSSLKDKRLVRNLVRLRDPLIAKRVRSLILGATFVGEALEQGECEVTKIYTLRLRNARGYFQRELSLDDLTQEMAAVVKSLNGITELTISFTRISEYRAIRPLINASFASSCTSLLRLKLSLPYIFIPKLVTLNLVFTNIRYFDVTLEGSYTYRIAPNPVPVLMHLTAFITRHANTLQSVGLVLPEPMKPEESFDSVLEALSTIAHLRSLSMTLPFDTIPAPKLLSLVESTGGSLRDLHLRKTKYVQATENSALSWIRQDLPHCSLPNLRKLVVGRALLPTHYSAAVQWIQSFSTITKLDLRYDVLVRAYKDYDYQTLIQFLGSRNTIKCLRLEVPLLDSHLLAQLVNNFEGLQWLYLTFWRVNLHTEEKDRGKVRDNQIAYFRADLDEATLRKWNLRHLRMACPCLSRRVVKMYANSLAECFPRLESWTSFGRQRFGFD